MSKPDLLVLAGDAAEKLEREGFVACGRRENGTTRVDFWTRDGRALRHELVEGLHDTLTVEAVVAACRAIAKAVPAASRSHLN